MKKILTLSTITAAALMAACATSKPPPAELLAARDAVRTAENDRRVPQYAPLELKRATDKLNQANALNDKGESLSVVASGAYVASRLAETAIAVAAAKANEESIKSADADRERARADARTAEARRAQAQATNARADAATAKAEAASADTRADAARMEASDAQARAQAARQQAATAQASASTAQMQTAALQAQLAELQAKQTDRGMLITLGDVLFEFGRADVKPGAQDALRKLASYLQEHPERRILIEGYTDSVGSDAANQMLSQRRAEAVAAALASLGIAPARLSTRGYGKSHPVADNGSDTNRALNRRVEVYISDNDQPVRSRG